MYLGIATFPVPPCKTTTHSSQRPNMLAKKTLPCWGVFFAHVISLLPQVRNVVFDSIERRPNCVHLATPNRRHCPKVSFFGWCQFVCIRKRFTQKQNPLCATGRTFENNSPQRFATAEHMNVLLRVIASTPAALPCFCDLSAEFRGTM